VWHDHHSRPDDHAGFHGLVPERDAAVSVVRAGGRTGDRQTGRHQHGEFLHRAGHGPVRRVGLFRDVGGAVGVRAAEAVPLPPAGEHPRVDVPGATEINQRERGLAGELAGARVHKQSGYYGHGCRVISLRTLQVPLFLSLRDYPHFTSNTQYSVQASWGQLSRASDQSRVSTSIIIL
jgi:hypothetical protein